MAIKVTVDREKFIKNLREIDTVARGNKNSPTFELSAVVYKAGRLFMRAESPITILQLAMDVETGPDDDTFRVAVNTKKLLACARQCKTVEIAIEVQKTGLKFGKGIRVATEDPIMFGRLPSGVSKAERICEIAVRGNNDADHDCAFFTSRWRRSISIPRFARAPASASVMAKASYVALMSSSRPLRS